VVALRPEVVSFHFGLPSKGLFDRVRATGARILSSATTVKEARWLESEGCDAVIAQGFEAGGHRGMFLAADAAIVVRDVQELQGFVQRCLEEPEFAIESYLRHQASTFVKRFDANTYLYLSRALTYFDLARDHGDGSLVEALRPVSARTLLIAFSSDWLYPPADSEALAAALRAAGKDAELHVIDAPYGHDCFLLEEARQTPMIRRFLSLPG
jgi:homoserine O-acetyltransferase